MFDGNDFNEFDLGSEFETIFSDNELDEGEYYYAQNIETILDTASLVEEFSSYF